MHDREEATMRIHLLQYQHSKEARQLMKMP